MKSTVVRSAPDHCLVQADEPIRNSGCLTTSLFIHLFLCCQCLEYHQADLTRLAAFLCYRVTMIMSSVLSDQYKLPQLAHWLWRAEDYSSDSSTFENILPLRQPQPVHFMVHLCALTCT